MKQLSPIGIKLLESLKAKPINEDQINQLLLNESLDDEEKQLLLQTFKKMVSERRQRPGFYCLGLGSFIGFISCVLTMMDVIPGLNGFFLYGLTTLAILVVLYGCYLVFE